MLPESLGVHGACLESAAESATPCSTATGSATLIGGAFAWWSSYGGQGVIDDQVEHLGCCVAKPICGGHFDGGASVSDLGVSSIADNENADVAIVGETVEIFFIVDGDLDAIGVNSDTEIFESKDHFHGGFAGDLIAGGGPEEF